MKGDVVDLNEEEKEGGIKMQNIFDLLRTNSPFDRRKGEYAYKNVSDAKRKQLEVRRKYGYNPTIFTLKKPNVKGKAYVVVQPPGLRKIR